MTTTTTGSNTESDGVALTTTMRIERFTATVQFRGALAVLFILLASKVANPVIWGFFVIEAVVWTYGAFSSLVAEVRSHSGRR